MKWEDDSSIVYPVNSDLREYAEKLWSGEVAMENLGLILDKIIPFVKSNSGKSKSHKSTLSSIKEKIFKNVKDFERFLNSTVRNSFTDYEVFFRNYEETTITYKSKIVTMKTKSRLVVGLGDESVYEISIRLHRNYGVPYIPGSALKGVAKHYAIHRLAENLVECENGDFFKHAGSVQNSVEEPDDSKVSGDVKSLSFEIDGVEMTFEDIRRIFGTQRWVGEVVFFDAFPTPEQLKSKPILELDIMNPHYQPYYQHGEAPGDWHSPTPIFILTVPKGFEFIFSLAPREAGDGEIVEKAEVLLREVLQRFGVGAKTSLGYGRFQ